MKWTLGYYESFGTQYRMLVMRGWIIVDTLAEVNEELDDIASLPYK